MRPIILFCLWACSALVQAQAMTPETLLGVYRSAAATDSGFRGFSVDRGRDFYHARVKGPNGEHSCSGCHGPDPRATVDGHGSGIRAECKACHLTDSTVPGDRAKIRREIRPMAPSVNPTRFTDADKAELWFDVNCFYVLGRPCTTREKGDFLVYLLSVQ